MLLLLAAVAAATERRDWKAARASNEALVAAADRLALDVQGGLFSGYHAGVHVAVRFGDVEAVFIATGLPSDLVLERESLSSTVAKIRGEPEVETGDPEFDARYVVRGPAALWLARLDAPTREQLLRLDATVDGGELRYSTGKRVRSADDIVARVESLAALARALVVSEGSTTDERLATNAVEDPVPGFRLACLRALRRSRSADPSLVTRTCDRLADDLEPAIALEAAEGASEAVALRTFSRIACDRSAHDALRVLALERALTKASPNESIALASALLHDESPALAVLAADRIGAVRHAAALPALVSRVRSGEPALQAAVCEAIGHIGSAAGEDALLHVLESGHPSAKPSAVWALGESGSLRAVEKLLPLSRRLVGGALQREAEHAIARIQYRLGGGERGGLSLAGDAGGALSEPARPGAVAIARKDPAG